MKKRKKFKEGNEFNYLKKAKGITLIALVITIIVLLILAGVTIATLTGENGILTRANDARENTEQAKEDELRKLTQAEAATYLEDYEYTDVSGEKITIPAKCAVSQVEGENTLEDGLVIIDANGNEWVWIKVPESVTESSTTDEEIENALINYAKEYRDTNYSDTWHEGCGLGEQEYTEKYSEMLQSIKANNGFFIGRYEVGSFDNPVISNDTTRKAVIQKGAYPYNWVTCGQAQELSEGLALGNRTSSLMFGIQWDLVLTYFEESQALTYEELADDSSSWGNYYNVSFNITKGKYSEDSGTTFLPVEDSYTKKENSKVLLTAGGTERNSRLNIYDLAGNIVQWTLEKSSSAEYSCVYRGGDYSNYGYAVNSASRAGDRASNSDNNIGFRPSLY